VTDTSVSSLYCTVSSLSVQPIERSSRDYDYAGFRLQTLKLTRSATRAFHSSVTRALQSSGTASRSPFDSSHERENRRLWYRYAPSHTYADAADSAGIADEMKKRVTVLVQSRPSPLLTNHRNNRVPRAQAPCNVASRDHIQSRRCTCSSDRGT
jgi:hypothetical protein